MLGTCLMLVRFARDARLDRACAACTDGTGRGPLCVAHAHEVDLIAARALAELRTHLHAAAEAVYAEPAPVVHMACPRCEGHGDVPTGRHHAHNPTGLEACPVCGGEGVVIDELATADAIDGALALWIDALDGDLTLDQALPTDHAYEALS